MRFPQDSLLQPYSGATAFLVLAWDEMFDPRTPDTFQPRLSNTPSLLTELFAIAARSEDSERWRKHLRIVQSELSAVTADEKDILKDLEYYDWLIQLCCHEQKPEYLSRHNPMLVEFRTLFHQSVQRKLLEAGTGLPMKKENALVALHRWATMALQCGCTATDMRSLATDHAFTLKPTEFLESLVAGVNLQPQTFWCILAVQGPTIAIQSVIRKIKFRLIKHEAMSRSAAKVQFIEKAQAVRSQPDSNIEYLGRQFTATSPRNAAIAAVRRIRDAVDVFNFYSERQSLSILPVALVTKGNAPPALIELGGPELRQRSPRRNAKELTLAALGTVTEDQLEGRILSAMEHYSLAHVSSATRVKLVNLWTALECLAGTAESIISGVCEMVAPIVVLRRADKILTYTATCLQECRNAGNNRPLGSGFPNARKNAVSREQLLLTLAKPENHADIIGLLTFAGGQPLLVNRLFYLWKKFSAPKELAVEMKRSKERIYWHLHRIYRARNLIVHEGKDTGLAHALLDNLHYYFSVTLSRILHGMQLQKGASVDESIAHWQGKSGYLLDSLENNPGRLCVKDVFPLPQRNDDTRIWSSSNVIPAGSPAESPDWLSP